MNSNYGVIFSRNEIYKPNADEFFVAFTKRAQLGIRTIPHYFVWDTHFTPIDTIDKYSKHLDTLKPIGIKKVCQTDFSCWFHYDKQRRENIIKNWEYFELAVEKGFEIYINFNTVFYDHFESGFYDKYFKLINNKCDVVLYDFNHNEKDFVKYEIETFKHLIHNVEFKTLVCFTGKTILKDYMPIFNFLKSKGINVLMLPTEMMKLRAKRKAFY